MADSIKLTSPKPIPNRPSVTEVDALMRQVSEQLGSRWLAAYDKGWMIKQDGQPGTHSRKRAFLDALSDTLDANIVVSIKS